MKATGQTLSCAKIDIEIESWTQGGQDEQQPSCFGTIFERVCQWLSDWWATQQRNLAWMITGLYLAEHVYLAKIASYRPGQATLTSKVRQLRRFVDNEAIDVPAGYEPAACTVLQAAAFGC